MTDDYKEQLLNYITGNLSIEGGNDIPIFEEIKSYENNFDNFMLQSDLATYEYFFSGFLRVPNISNCILYGTYNDTPHRHITKSFFVILDVNLNPIKLIYKYNTGTLFRLFQKLEVDENGNIYGIDYTYNYDGEGIIIDEEKRFVLLNNILTSNLIYGDYTAVLRKSYIMSYTNFTPKQIYKDNDSATYVMVGFLLSNQTTKPTVVSCKINVGEANEWNIYTYNRECETTMDSYILWGDESYNLKIVSMYYTNTQAKYLELLFDGTNFTENLVYNLPSYDGTPYTFISSIAFKNMNEVYYQLNAKKIILKTNYSTNSYNVIYEEEAPVGIAMYSNVILKTVNNNVFINFLIREIDEEYNTKYFLQFGIIVDDEIYLTEKLNINYTTDVNLFMINNNYNLYELLYQVENYLYSVSLDYSPLNYNGASYINYNSLTSSKGKLYSDDRLIFSRNLYNKTLLNNSTISTIQIPNGLLNNIDISKNELLSETNLTLIQNDQTFTKNIYETVFLNYINQISVIDEDTNTPYINSAIKVNNSINIGTQTSYENSACTKYRINYTDTTTQINNLEWLPINKYNKTTQITFYADKNITSIDLISEDETTVYLNIPVEVEIGNTYTIRQKVRTGNKPTPVQLQYNNENINYNNEPVMVYTEEE